MVIPAAEINFDERHARLDQSASHQAASAKAVGSVAILNFLRLLQDLKGVHLLAGHQVQRLLEYGLVIDGGWAAVLTDETGFQQIESLHPLIQTTLVDAHFQIANLAR